MYRIGRKKIRGLKHKHKTLKKRISDICSVFPENTGTYWHMHMPCSNSILDYPKVRHKFSQDLAGFLIEQSKHLNTLKPKDHFAKIVCYLPLSYLWDAQIIIFFNEEYYDSFFRRNDKYQKWIPIELSQALKSRWHIFDDSTNFRGYHEKTNDEECSSEQDIWFYEC